MGVSNCEAVKMVAKVSRPRWIKHWRRAYVEPTIHWGSRPELQVHNCCISRISTTSNALIPDSQHSATATQ